MNPTTINPDEMRKSTAAQAVKRHEQIRATRSYPQGAPDARP